LFIQLNHDLIVKLNCDKIIVCFHDRAFYATASYDLIAFAERIDHRFMILGLLLLRSDNQKITAETYLESWLNTLENSNSDEIYRMFVIKGAEDFAKKKVDRSSVGIKAQENKLIVTLNSSVKNFD